MNPPATSSPLIRPWNVRLGAVLVVVCAGCSEAASPSIGTQGPTPGNVLAGESRQRLILRDPYPIRITGSNMCWRVQYHGADGRELFAGEGLPLRDIHVPQGSDIVLFLNSADYIYSLSLKQQGIREIAVPDLEFRVEFHPAVAGTFDLVGDELCGEPHPDLQGHLIVEPREQFVQWLSDAKAEAAE
jgi:heme/copper-type cytochrome/quinol oxidase subunit 2